MEKKDKLCFVQFIHPSKQHLPDCTTIKNWNKVGPGRKFFKNKGCYVYNDKLEESEIGFWGEWEPESEVVKKIDKPVPNGCHYIYKPYYTIPSSYYGLRDTDPFVFGNQFHYTACQQNAKKGPTQLRNLSRGSVILFGSRVDRKFVLDTVFVVDRWIDHDKRNYENVLRGKISEVYFDVTILALYHQPSSEFRLYKLYFGAMFHNPIQGMYSFFPCIQYYDNSKGFARPVIEIKGIITDNLSQGKRLNILNNIGQAKMLWDNVAKQVTRKGLALGIFTNLPAKRNNIGFN
jgi:hypothetical protein